MSMHPIPLSDPRRNRRGNRTLRMPKGAWETICRTTYWPRHDPGTKARRICRVDPLYVEGLSEIALRDIFSQNSSPTAMLKFLIHDHGDNSSPMLQRKKYASVIRQLLTQMRYAHSRVMGYRQPGQNFNRLPG